MEDFVNRMFFVFLFHLDNLQFIGKPLLRATDIHQDLPTDCTKYVILSVIDFR